MVRLVDRFGFATWYLTEFDPQTRLARAYVSGIGLQTWTTISLDELLSVHAFYFLKRVRVDRAFQPCYFRQLPAVSPAGIQKRRRE